MNDELYSRAVVALGSNPKEKLEELGWRWEIHTYPGGTPAFLAKIWNPSVGSDLCAYLAFSMKSQEEALIQACGSMMERCCHSGGLYSISKPVTDCKRVGFSGSVLVAMKARVDRKNG